MPVLVTSRPVGVMQYAPWPTRETVTAAPPERDSVPSCETRPNARTPPAGPAGPAGRAGPAGSDPALKSAELSEPFLTFDAVIALLAMSTFLTAWVLIWLEPTLLLASVAAAYDVPPSAAKSAR